MQTAAPEIPGDQAAVDAGMRWMVDFDEAEAAGMGLRIPLSAANLAGGIESLIVLGAAAGATANEGAKQLGEQLDAQHYTDGLEFLRFGTPSNNTSAERSGYGAEDTGHERSFATESGAVEVTLDAQSNAQRLGTALGLPGADIAPVLASVGGGSDRHEVDLRSMNTALWQATWGYFLTQHDRHGRHGPHAGHSGVGARALHRTRSQRRTVPAVALWQAAVRRPAGHVARLLASACRRGSRECA